MGSRATLCYVSIYHRRDVTVACLNLHMTPNECFLQSAFGEEWQMEESCGSVINANDVSSEPEHRVNRWMSSLEKTSSITLPSCVDIL